MNNDDFVWYRSFFINTGLMAMTGIISWNYILLGLFYQAVTLVLINFLWLCLCAVGSGYFIIKNKAWKNDVDPDADLSKLAKWTSVIVVSPFLLINIGLCFVTTDEKLIFIGSAVAEVAFLILVRMGFLYPLSDQAGAQGGH